MAQSVSNIVLPGPCRVYIAPSGTAAPASSVSKNTEWGGSWVEVGFTEGGVVLKQSTEYFEKMVDQYNASVADFVTEQTGEVTFGASEATLLNIRQALGYGTITAGSTESTLGISGADGFPTYYAVGFEVFGPGASSSNNYYRRAVVWKALPKSEVELNGKKDESMVVQYTMRATIDTSQAATERLWKLIDRVA